MIRKRQTSRPIASFEGVVWGLVAAALIASVGSRGVSAQMAGAPSPGYKREAGMPSTALPNALREIGFDQNIGQALPLDTPFADEQGRTVPLGTFFGKRAVVLVFVYYECPMLCSQVLNALASSLDVMSLEPGRDFDIVTISFDPSGVKAT